MSTLPQHGRTIDKLREGAPHEHVVHVYTDDSHLLVALAGFISHGLSQDESVVVVATGQHLAAISRMLDCGSQLGAQTLVLLDAAEILRKFMREGAPDPAAFEATIGGIVDRAAGGGRPVRVYGEMVAALWDQGNVAGALALEALWNDLAATRQFYLMCAYPSASFDDGSLHALNSMCQLHSELSLLGDALDMPGDRLTGPDPVAHKLFIPVAAAVAAARHFTVATLMDWKLSHLVDDAALIVTELATNSVVHANSAFRVVMSPAPLGVRFAVEDASQSRPRMRHPGPYEPGGRGIALIAEIAHQWGCDVSPVGKTVWADVPA
ncbi:MEDS domain-containing protein [Mycobacterium colombiense]|uniref:MEDS domain-containing protein n=1 Tax=Mycobacterium colombiense TaxID=339268 RepID=UPI001401EB59|nr:MEDS domain-containing protein [Mycobacterium colombiense]